jgi:hypothetical protein
MLFPEPDTLTFDVFLGEGSMVQSVLLLGQPKAVKAMLRDDSLLGEERRLSDFAKIMQVSFFCCLVVCYETLVRVCCLVGVSGLLL